MDDDSAFVGKIHRDASVDFQVRFFYDDLPFTLMIAFAFWILSCRRNIWPNA